MVRADVTIVWRKADLAGFFRHVIRTRVTGVSLRLRFAYSAPLPVGSTATETGAPTLTITPSWPSLAIE